MYHWWMARLVLFISSFYLSGTMCKTKKTKNPNSFADYNWLIKEGVIGLGG